MELLSAMQKNMLVIANTKRESFAACLTIEGTCNTLQACTLSQVACNDSLGPSHKRSRNMAREACSAQRGGGFAKPLRRGRSSRRQPPGPL